MAYDWRNPERVVPWKPRQRFEVTPLGHEALARYREAVRAAQQGPNPRVEIERAQQDWATSLVLRPMDGILLEELADGRTCLADLKETLETLTWTLREARGAMDRMKAAGLIEPVGEPVGS
jgi:hypothetical protein